MAYCTLTQVRDYLGIGNSDDNALIEDSLIPRAQDIIDDYCKRTFEASADSTRYFTVGRDTEGSYLWFDEDICSITTVTNGDASSTVITSSQYTTQPKNRTPYYGIKILRSSGVWWEFVDDPEDAISVAGKWAYSTTAPASVVHACVRLTAFLYRQKDTSIDIDRPLVTDAGVTILPAAIPKDIAQVLSPFVRRGV